MPQQNVTPRERGELRPGEPPEALPWRLLAEERAEAAWRVWSAAQPSPEPRELVEGVDVAWTRAELPPEAAQPEADPEKLQVHPWQGGASLRWRDVEAFLTKIP